MNFTTRRTRSSSLPNPKGLSSFRSIFLALCIIGGITLVVIYSWVRSVGAMMVDEGNYNIGKGETLSSLDTTLGLDVGNTRYKLWLKWFSLDRKLEVGTYRVDQPITLEEFVQTTLDTPVHSDLTITLLPGWNIYDMDEYFQKGDVLKVGEFIETAIADFPLLEKKFPFLKGAENLEGFLLPDTYRIRTEAGAREIIEVMLREFEKKIGPDYMKMERKEAYDTLILASIVEREERNLEVQPIVAGILAKRLREGMPIGADATVCYGYAKTQKQCTPSFIGSVIYDKNPYNTRSTLGLPPSPISSIKVDTWKNTLNKEESAYYYYLHDGDGMIHYAKTNDEHNANKRQYLQ